MKISFLKEVPRVSLVNQVCFIIFSSSIQQIKTFKIILTKVLLSHEQSDKVQSFLGTHDFLRTFNISYLEVI